jgi:hypothetical protein
MGRPKQMWFVEVKIGDAKPVNNVYYGSHHQRGGKFSSLKAALDRRKSVLSRWPDAEVKVFGSGLIHWTEIS